MFVYCVLKTAGLGGVTILKGSDENQTKVPGAILVVFF